MKRTTPFKDNAEFDKDLQDFANKFHVTLAEHSYKTNEYFEISCYNLILRYYEKRGYKLEVMNLKGSDFKFKCNPNGFLENFSYFKATKTNRMGNDEVVYVFHNATVQSAFDDKVFTTPDIVVAKTSIAKETTDHYITKLKLTYIGRDDLITFCEAKHITPFPELMINFIGTLHELKPECMNDEGKQPSEHLAPSLMISGTFGKPTKRIKDSFENRYYINYLDNLFDDASVRLFFSKSQLNKLATLGKKSEQECDYKKTDEMTEELKQILNEIE